MFTVRLVPLSPPFRWFMSMTFPIVSGLLMDCGVAAYAEETERRRSIEPYVSGFITRSAPISAGLSLGGDDIPATTLTGSSGGGMKVGAFFKPFHYAFGAELEVFGHGGNVTAPMTTNGGVTRFTNQNLTMVNTMVNLLARYPGDFIQPYVGFGPGLSIAILDGKTQTATGPREGSSSLVGLAFQGIAGTRLNLTKHIFVFGEYKYFVGQADEGRSEEEEQQCRDTGNCPPIYKFDYETHYVTVGVGFSF